MPEETPTPVVPGGSRLSRAAAGYLRSTVGERAQAEAGDSAPDPNAPVAFSLGWQMAELHRLGFAPHVTLVHPSSPRTLGPLAANLAGEVGVAQVRATLSKLKDTLDRAGVPMPDLDPLGEALSGQHEPERWHIVAQHVHWDILGSLHAADERLSKAYELGRALAETCQGPQSGEDLAAMLRPDRVNVLTGWLDGLISALPVHSARSVRLSLERWAAATGQPSAGGGEVSGALHRQGELWQALLAGDTRAIDLLGTGDYMQVNARVNRRTRQMLAGLLRVYWFAVMIVVALVVGSLVMIILVKNAASGVAGAVGVISALGLSVKGVGIVSEVRGPLLDREIEVAVADAITLVPPRPRERES